MLGFLQRSRPYGDLLSADSNIKDAKKFINLVRKESGEVICDLKFCKKNESRLSIDEKLLMRNNSVIRIG